MPVLLIVIKLFLTIRFNIAITQTRAEMFIILRFICANKRSGSEDRRGGERTGKVSEACLWQPVCAAVKTERWQLKIAEVFLVFSKRKKWKAEEEEEEGEGKSKQAARCRQVQLYLVSCLYSILLIFYDICNSTLFPFRSVRLLIKLYNL